MNELEFLKAMVYDLESHKQTIEKRIKQLTNAKDVQNAPGGKQ